MKKILIIFTILAGISATKSQAQTFITAAGVHLSWQLPLPVVDVVNYDYPGYVWVHTERIRFNGRLRFRLILKDGPSYVELYLNRHGYVLDRLYHDYYPLVNHTCYDCGYHSYYYHNYYYPSLISMRVRPHYYYHRPYYSFRYVHNYNHYHHHKHYYRDRPVSRRYHDNHHVSRRDSYRSNKTYRNEGARATRSHRNLRNNNYDGNSRSRSGQSARVQHSGSSRDTYRNRPESTRRDNYRKSQPAGAGKSADYTRSRQSRASDGARYQRSRQGRTGNSSRGSQSQPHVKKQGKSSEAGSSKSNSRGSRPGRSHRSGGR